MFSSDDDEEEKMILRSKRARRLSFYIDDDDEGNMSFRSKRMRRKWSFEEDDDDEDRISSLSDEVLHKIMSFMNTKYAVQTCVLSKRWKFLWKSLPYLDFNIETFPFQGVTAEEVVEEEEEDYDDADDDDGKYDDEDEDYKDIKPKMRCFSNFISQVVFRRQPTNLIKVCLRCYTYKQYGFSVEWLLCYAVEHNVQQLSIISYSCSYPFLLPRSLFTCQSLTSLKLKDCHAYSNHLKLPEFLALPALKSLHLQGFQMTGKNFDTTIFSGCPNLESLKLFVEQPKDLLCINSLNLKFLELSCDWTVENYRCKVVIDAPRLMTFKYKGVIPIVCTTNNLPPLDDVYVDICCLDSEFEHKKQEYALRLINTLKEFHHAKSLTLSWETFEVLAKSPSLLEENRLSFPNLKYLKLEGWPSGKFEMPGCILNCFLNNSATLKLC